MTSRKFILAILILVLFCFPFRSPGINAFTGEKTVTDSISIKSEAIQRGSPSILSATGSAETNSFTVKSITDDELLIIEDVTPELSLEGRIPLILTHGWNFGDATPTPPGFGYWEYFKNFVLNDPELRSYFKPYYVKYWSNAVSVKELGGLLRDKMEQAGFHEKQIVMISHSMGGLVSRSFMNEHSFNTGINAGKKCGDIVKLLITLGTSHHGSPMANGPARDNKAGFPLNLLLPIIEASLFSEVNYDEINRSDLRWDNYDNLFNHTKYPKEKNDWLANLNSYTEYDSKLVCYSSSVTGENNLSPSGVEEEYKTGSYLMKTIFGFENDGIVPVQSSSFVGHTPKRIRTFSEYNHADIVKGKADGSELFNPMKEDLLEIIPPQILSPTNQGVFFKHSQIHKITWKAPSTMQKVNIYFSGDNGQSYNLLANNIDAALSSYQWSVPDTNLTQCLIKITNAGNEAEFTCSANAFTIYHNQLSIIKPLANIYFVPNKTNQISWQQLGIASSVQIKYYDPKNNFEKVIIDDYPVSQQTNSFDWEPDNSVPPTNSAYVIIQLLKMNELYGDDEIYTATSVPFMMLGQPQITVSTPSAFPIDDFGIGGEKLVVDSFYTIRWQTEGEIKYVKVSLCDSSKNIISEIKKKNQQPGIHSNGFTNWRIPEVYGNKFYLFLEAGPDQNTISATAYSDFSFRINRNTNILNLLNGQPDVSLLPCFEIEPVKNAVGYYFQLDDSATQGTDYSCNFSSESAALCLPNTIENELLPGATYQLTAHALFDSVESYSSKVCFQTSKMKPLTFQTITPTKGDTTEGITIAFDWSRAIGTQEYEVGITNQDQTLFSETFSRTDTSITVNLGKSGIPDTLFWKVTARNSYGETLAGSYFFKKHSTDFKQITVEQTDNYNLINYPNPFVNETTFEFILPGSDKTYQMEISVYNLSGQKVRTISKSEKRSGLQKVIWDGKDESGVRVEKGIYFGCLSVDEKTVTRSIIAK